MCGNLERKRPGSYLQPRNSSYLLEIPCLLRGNTLRSFTDTNWYKCGDAESHHRCFGRLVLNGFGLAVYVR